MTRDGSVGSAPRLPPVLTAEEMREWERRCFAPGGVSERVVMESAGRAVALHVARYHPVGRVVAAVGRGNNGGDAVVALRTLAALGREVATASVGGDEAPGELSHGWELPLVEPTEAEFREAAVVLDGILGTGASGAPREPARAAIRAMNRAGRPIVAIDGPSGVDLTSGRVAGDAVAAEATVTFGAIKRGLLLPPGRSLAGRILLAEVGFPPFDPDGAGAALITAQWAGAHLPRIPPDAHKTSVGLVGVVAGRKGFGGAAIMTAMGALRSGCGGVRVCSVEANRLAVHAAVPEAVFVDRDGEGVHEALAGTRAIAAGPGIGTDAGAAKLLRAILERFPGGLLLDADALSLLAADPSLLPAESAARCVLTPHPGELARLLGTTTDEVLADRFASVAAAAERFGCAVLAKGFPSLVAAPDRPTLVNVSGHSGVATGGTGDTLAGIIATFLAADLPPLEAAATGLFFAGRAAVDAGRGRGTLPRDIADALPHVLSAHPADPYADPPFTLDLQPAY